MGADRILRSLTLPADPSVLSRRPDLLEILAGTGAFLPVPDDEPAATRLAAALGAGVPIDDDVALVISTSGSTGTPKGAQHTAASLAASARATEIRLGGPGGWLLALAPHHIAGLQVMLRSLAAGVDPVILDLRTGFDPEAYVRALDELTSPRRYTSLVPTQLIKVLDSPAATAATAQLDAVLVGGAATPAPLLARARDVGLPIVCTYGMSETAGGCVYDGIALPGVTVRLTDTDDGVGRVELSGPMIARGYRNLPDHPAFADPGWFRTDDLGRVDDGVLTIVGRADEAISTGGLTVIPQVVEAVIADDPAVAECAVVGLPDDRLGERVVAFVVAAAGARVDEQRIRNAVTERLDRYAAPRAIVELAELPARGPGKVDRRELRRRFG
ncbi:o-succinylbenzoate--CoA ligase [Gordonia sp. ABSL1-1]|uniref:o-succinylbenzoate--CoA ligase n=1 Tax=Gordonia sp. ABSL1-1 TaxID=3053923 RepID=UPI0025732926|nr:o-succinylbenzoate--CoA ligase [Gordonia sp. ABSL1-1]MDL9936064.1 o-succinylbenzoate--CoA ligase [Gordonia sp. ABSL1-1]